MKKRKILLRGAAVMMTASITLGGCGTSNSSSANKEENNMDKNQVLNFVATDFKSLDPSIISDGGSFTALTNVYDGLMRQVVHDDGKVTAEFAGAESVDVSKDGLKYTFHLRKNAKWSDGKPVTAEQYVYSWKRIINPATGADYMTLLAELNVKGAQEIVDVSDDLSKSAKLIDNLGVKAKDDYTLEVELSKPTPFFLNAMTMKVLVPIREDKVKEFGDSFGSDPKKAVFNGPFVISDYNKGSNITYTKNKEYWNADKVKLETGKGHIINETTTAVKMFEAGELDVITASGDDIARLKKSADKGQFKYYPQTGFFAGFDYFNFTRPIVKNKKVRQALSFALNRDEFCNIVYKKYDPAYGLLPGQISSTDTDYRKAAAEPLKTVKTDVKKLMEEGLKEEGVKASDVTITFLLDPKSSISEKTGDYIHRLYKDTFGINVKIDYAADSQTLVKRLYDGDFDIATGGWGADYDDVSSFFNVFSTKNSTNAGKYSNTEYDKLVAEANSELDSKKRIELYKKAEKILLVDDAAAMPVYYSDKNTFRQNYVKNYMIPKFAGSYDLSTVYISGK